MPPIVNLDYFQELISRNVRILGQLLVTIVWQDPEAYFSFRCFKTPIPISLTTMPTVSVVQHLMKEYRSLTLPCSNDQKMKLHHLKQIPKKGHKLCKMVCFEPSCGLENIVCHDHCCNLHTHLAKMILHLSMVYQKIILILLNILLWISLKDTLFCVCLNKANPKASCYT